ncbi:LAFA_0B07536g1_1 [Lachancea sp. 'fantastica']|nr:LAFA_0B07536g1_1 [Lachancea sp. 'fantastica']
MRGRTTYSDPARNTDTDVGNTSELSAMFSADNHYKQKRVPLLRTTSLKLPNKQLYTVKENSHEEPAIPSTNVSYHASKLMANRQRSSAASLLYTNVKNKRNSSNLSLKDMHNSSTASSGHSSVSSTSRPALNVVIQDPKNSIADAPLPATQNNPINHYQFARNMATRPKSTGTAYLAADRAGSTTSLNVELRPHKTNANTSGSQGSTLWPHPVHIKPGGHLSQAEKTSTLGVAGTNGDHTVMSLGKDAAGENALLETQIETAMSEELFSKDYVFDNCFDDIIQDTATGGNDKFRSAASSNQSPLTRMPARRLSKTDSATLEDFQHDLLNRSSAGSQDTAYTSRLQMKMETMKNRFDSFVTNNDSLGASGNSTAIHQMDACSHESDNSILFTVPNVSKSVIDIYREKNDEAVAGDPKVQFPKFWFHHDLRTKLLTEERSNQLRTIERFSSSGAAGEKVVTSRIKSLSQEGYLTDLSEVKKGKINRARGLGTETPVLTMTNALEHSEFEQLFLSTRNFISSAENSEAVLDPEKMYLKEQILFGKAVFNKFWRDAEQIELMQLSLPGSSVQQSGDETATTKIDGGSASSHIDRVSDAGMPFSVPPNLLRQASH